MPPASAVAVPGPAALGRGVIVGPDQAAPTPWADAPRFVIDDEVLAHPGPAAAVLHHHWLHRLPVVIEYRVDNAEARREEICDRPPYRVSPRFTFERERLHFLTWANTYDARSGEPVWWHGVLAQRRGGRASDVADVQLPDDVHAWVDGGPRGPLDVPPEQPLVHRESVALGRLTVQGDAEPAEPLAPDQLEAVTHASGPARIIAPAGSGKTRVLTARLRHLLRDRHVEPELVTAVAYNTRAAEELRERTRGLGASIRTIHSLALMICNLDERREVIGERDQRAILDQLISVARVPNTDPFQPWLEALTEVRLALRDPLEVETTRGDVDGFADVFERYREQLARRRVIDFDEQIYRALELLLTRPDLRTRIQRMGTHLLVDEFQDLTPAFLLLVRLVAGPPQQIFGVGDDDQTIYRYAGASPEYLVRFADVFPGAASHPLEINYRCPPEVVEAASSLLSHNRHRVPKTIRSGKAVAT
jgi:hypothetical protein